MTEPISSRALRIVGQLGVGIGAVGSIILMLRVGGRNQPVLLVLFFGWVLSPFVALALADWRSTHWFASRRTSIHALMLIVTLGSLAVYGGFIPMPAGSRPAAAYLMVPLGAWLLIATEILADRLLARRASRSQPPAQP